VNDVVSYLKKTELKPHTHYWLLQSVFTIAHKHIKSLKVYIGDFKQLYIHTNLVNTYNTTHFEKHSIVNNKKTSQTPTLKPQNILSYMYE